MLVSQLLKNLANISFNIPSKFADISIQHITNDSRAVTQNGLFLAFPGEKNDGRDYIAKAAKQGAIVICYENLNFQSRFMQSLNLSERENILFVPIENLKQKQGIIAARFYDFPGKKLKIIGVTGTNGKSSITHYIAQSLCCPVIGTLGYGFLPNLIKTMNTTPDALELQKILFELKNQGAKIVAMEVSSHGLVENRVENIFFDIVVFTNLTQDHLDFHQTMKNYRSAKELIFQLPGLKYAVINIDDHAGKYFAKKYENKLSIITISSNKNKNADINVKKLVAIENGFDLNINTPFGFGSFYLPLLGKFNIQNSLAVLGVLGILKMPFRSILKKMTQLQNVTGRMQLYQFKNTPRVIVDFAHTPDALENILKTLRNHSDQKLWCVFGCGGDRDRTKRPKMGKIAETYCDKIIITNDNPRSELPEKIAQDILHGISNQSKVTIQLDRQKAIQTVIQLADQHDLIVVAGKGHETEQIMKDEILHFNDGEAVMAQLKCRK
ncbi:MAG: hypothetical protein ACD_29C00011G0002 [uncultured bacterium]|nr:MAG: hypothetical protein ACD_29C00011G0002 [uncultured bacterium]